MKLSHTNLLPAGHEVTIYRPNPGEVALKSKKVKAKDLGLTGRQFKKLKKQERRKRASTSPDDV